MLCHAAESELSRMVKMISVHHLARLCCAAESELSSVVDIALLINYLQTKS